MENFDYGAARFWMDVLQVASVCLLAVYTHMSNRSKVNREAINALRGDVEHDVEKLEDRVARSERHLDVLESRLNGAPTHQDLGKVYERLNTVAESMENISGQFTAVSRQLALMNEYLLNNKGDRG